MRLKRLVVTAGLALAMSVSVGAVAQPQAEEENPDVRTLVSRLALAQYRATLKGLTQFGDRRQGTKRNRDAIDWIETQLKAVGCTTTERIDYVFDPPPRNRRRRGRRELNPTGGIIGRNGSGPGGSSIFDYRGRTGVNTDPLAQPDEALRELNREPATNGPRQEVYCTKVGTAHPDEMYIIGVDRQDFLHAVADAGNEETRDDRPKHRCRAVPSDDAAVAGDVETDEHRHHDHDHGDDHVPG